METVVLKKHPPQKKNHQNNKKHNQTKPKKKTSQKTLSFYSWNKKTGLQKKVKSEHKGLF